MVYVIATPTLYEHALVRAGVQGPLARAAAEVQVLACGMGPGSAIALSRRLEATAYRLNGLALIGWAGGLSPDLVPGDVVLADQALDERTHSDARGEPVPCTVVHLPGARVGALLTVSAPLLTPQAKHAAQASVALANGPFANVPLAVEMEAYPLAAWAWQRKMPFVHARVILDAANEALPDLADALDPLGWVRPGRLAWRLLQRPKLIIPLLRLVIRARRLGPVLAQVARAIARLWQQ